MMKLMGARAATVVLCLLTGIASFAAEPDQPDPSKPDATKLPAFGVSTLAARELVKANCTRCHLEPQPLDLPREYWPIALHWMSNYVGYKGDEFPDFKVEEMAKGPSAPPGTSAADAREYDYARYYFMTDPAGRRHMSQIFKDFMIKTDDPPMTPSDWNLLRSYFVSQALPVELMKIRRAKQPVLQGFESSVPPLGLPSKGTVLSLGVDSLRHRLYVAKTDGTGGWGSHLYAFDMRDNRRIGELSHDVSPGDPAVYVAKDGVARASVRGWFPVKRDDTRGKIFDWSLDGKQSRVRLLANGFSMLTQANTADLDGDGLEDIVTTTFGDGLLEGGGGHGRLMVLWQTPQFAKLWKGASAEVPIASQGAFTQTVLLPRAGMIGSAIGDFNNDGKPDIALLTAQAQQQLLLFVNKGNREFEMHVILERDPSFGHISLKAGDFNGDGKLDIMILNGNNAELVVPRPQHGIRIYQNNGDLSFTERFEYPMHGAARAVVADFDGDGDLDVAAIAMWPDWDLSEPESFVYLENKGSWKFEPFSTKSSDWGAWTDIATGDVNADGKLDIVLGYGAFGRGGAAGAAAKEREGKEPWVMYLLNRH